MHSHHLLVLSFLPSKVTSKKNNIQNSITLIPTIQSYTQIFKTNIAGHRQAILEFAGLGYCLVLESNKHEYQST